MENYDFEYHKKLADEGNAFSAYIVAVHYENGIEVQQDEGLQVKYLGIAAKGGNAEACYKLGELCLEVDKLPMALYWFATAAQRGDPQAQNAIGVLCENKIFSTPAYSQCVYWYTLSAENGYDVGEYNLARMYEFGFGVDKDIDKAFALYEKSAGGDYPDAILRLAKFYREGVCVEKDEEKATELTKRGLSLKIDETAQLFK